MVVGSALLGGLAALVLVVVSLSGSHGCRFGGGCGLAFALLWRTAVL